MTTTSWAGEIDVTLLKINENNKNQPINKINQKQQLSQNKMLQK